MASINPSCVRLEASAERATRRRRSRRRGAQPRRPGSLDDRGVERAGPPRHAHSASAAVARGFGRGAETTRKLTRRRRASAMRAPHRRRHRRTCTHVAASSSIASNRVAVCASPRSRRAQTCSSRARSSSRRVADLGCARRSTSASRCVGALCLPELPKTRGSQALDLEALDVRARHQRGSAREQLNGRAVVAAPDSPLARPGARRSAASVDERRRIVARVASIQARLLEMVTDDLVEPAMHVEPARQLLVEASALGLGDRRRRSRRGSARGRRETRPRRDARCPAERTAGGRARASAVADPRRPFRRKRVDGRTRELATDDSRPLEDVPLPALDRLSSRLASSDSSDAGTRPASSGPSSACAASCSRNKRVPLGGRDDRGACVGVERNRLRKRLEQLTPSRRRRAAGARACRPPRRGERRAAPSVRGTRARSVRRCSSRRGTRAGREDVGSAQCTSSSTTRSGRSRARVSRSLRDRPEDVAAVDDTRARKRLVEPCRRLLAVGLVGEQGTSTAGPRSSTPTICSRISASGRYAAPSA